MRLATWNVNSLRARADRVETWLLQNNIDILCIQETKCRDENFPWELFENNGYEVAHFGQGQWNGVAIASRVGLREVTRTFPDQPTFPSPAGEPIQEARALGATCAGVRIWSLYVPNGRGLNDPHMTYKLDWLRTLHRHAHHWLEQHPQTAIALTGDWNIAPHDRDVWDIDYFLAEGLTHVSDKERHAFGAFETSGFHDVVRPYCSGPENYTYWDYQKYRFPRNEGMRIDFILASPALAQRVTHASIDFEERRGKGASDHAPVVVDFQGQSSGGTR